METNEFDRADFVELLGMLDSFGTKVGELKQKTGSFYSSFNSGLKITQKLLSFLKVSDDTGLAKGLEKIQEVTGQFEKWIEKSADNITGKWVVNAKATVEGLASVSEMTYNVLSTITSLDKLGELKITTDAKANQTALEGIVGTGEKMRSLFDELSKNPLLKNIGIEGDVIGKLKGKWEVLLGVKGRLVELMTISGEAKETVKSVVGDISKMVKFNPVKGLGEAVGSLFKKKEDSKVEKGEKKGFFSIFRKKDPEDKDWFSAVAGRFKEFSERTKNSVQERVKPLLNYGVQLAQNYSPGFDVASNLLKLKKIGGKFTDTSKIAWFEAANGWGIGNEKENLKQIGNTKQEGVKRDGNIQKNMDKVTSLQAKVQGIVGKIDVLAGNPQEAAGANEQASAGILKEVVAPDLQGNMPDLLNSANSSNPVSITIERLVENLNVKSENLTEGMAEIRDIVVNELSRIVFNANKMALQ